MNQNEEMYIIDTSYNSNDQLILPLLVKKLNVIAITVVGSSREHSSQEIKLRIEEDLVKNCGSANIPVFAGADRPYIDYQAEFKDDKLIDPYNYTNFDWSEITQNANKNVDQKIDIGLKLSNTAAIKIAEFVRAFDKRLNIIALGPLTNLSLAILIDSNLKDGFKNLYVIGGSYNNLGNSGTCAEYNFRVDPVASKNVILYYKNIILLPLEIEEQIARVLKSEGSSTQKLSFLQKALNIKDDQVKHSFIGIFAALVIVNGQLVKTKTVKPCDVDIIGRYTRGAVAAEKYDYLKSGKFNDVTIIEEVHVEELVSAFNDINNL